MTEKSWVHYLCFDAYFEDALMKMRSVTGLGATYALFTALNEYFYEHGYMDEKGYQYHKERYGLPLVDEFEKQLQMRDQTLSLEIRKKRLELENLASRKRPDYSKMSIEELQSAYDRAKKLRNTTTVQLLAFELKKRGFPNERP